MSSSFDPPRAPAAARALTAPFLACLAFALVLTGLVGARLGMAEVVAILYLYSENLVSPSNLLPLLPFAPAAVEYELFMLPSERAEGRGPDVPAFTRWLRSAFAEFDFSGHYHMVFLAPRSEARDELRRILLANGGISLEEHLRALARERLR